MSRQEHQQGRDIREKLEIHLKEKLQEMGSRGGKSMARHHHVSKMDKSHSLDGKITDDYQRISDAMSYDPNEIKPARALIHRESQK